MSFKEMVEYDVANVFQNPEEHAEKAHVVYDGTDYHIPIILDHTKQKDRNIVQGDNVQGVYRVVSTMYAALSDMGRVPEHGERIWIDGTEYYVVTGECEIGQIALGLGAFDE